MTSILWFVSVSRLLSDVREKATDARHALRSRKKTLAAKINGYLQKDREQLSQLWGDEGLPAKDLSDLWRHIGFGQMHDYDDILSRDIPRIERAAHEHILNATSELPTIGFESLLDPLVREHSLKHYSTGHYREAVLNAILGISDLIRKRTGIDADGVELVGAAFSLAKPRLIFSEIESESGRNDQKGFMQILQGMYQGIRNPKAHSLAHDLNEYKAAQYLVFLSLLARRVSEAVEVSRRDPKSTAR